MPYKDPEAKRAWRKANRDKAAKHKADFEARHPDRIDAYKRKQALANRITSLFRRNIAAYLRSTVATTITVDKRHRMKLRDQVITFLGGCCEWCGQDEPLCLEIDHIRPIHRRTNGIIGWSSAEFWRAILRGEDDNAQLLCANCHAIKTRLGGEHSLMPSTVPFHPWDTETASNDNIRSETVLLQSGAVAA